MYISQQNETSNEITILEAKMLFKQTFKYMQAGDRNNETEYCMEGIYLDMDWENAKSNPIVNILSVPIKASSLSIFEPFDESDEIPSVSMPIIQVAELIFSRNISGQLQIHIFKTIGKASYRALYGTSGNSYFKQDSLFDGVAGYFDTSDSILQLYKINSNKVSPLTFISNIDNVSGVIDRNCTSYLNMLQSFPCTGSGRHTCLNANQCNCGWTSGCQPPVCSYSVYCDGGSSFTSYISTTSNPYPSFPQPPPNTPSNGTTTGGGISNTGGNTGGGTILPPPPNGNIYPNPFEEDLTFKKLLNTFKIKYAFSLQDNQNLSFAIECYSDNVYEPGGTGGSSAANTKIFENCVLQSLFYGLDYDQDDINFVKQYPKTLDKVLEILRDHTTYPAPSIPGSPNPLSQNRRMCSQFFTFNSYPSSGGITHHMDIGDLTVAFLPIIPSTTSYVIEIPNVDFSFFSSAVNSLCISNYNSWASSSMNSGLENVNSRITSGFFTNPNNPNINQPLNLRVRSRFRLDWFKELQDLTVTCGQSADGVYLISPTILFSSASLGIDFDTRINSVNCP